MKQSHPVIADIVKSATAMVNGLMCHHPKQKRGFTYAVRDGSGLTKIGFASVLEHRLQTLQLNNGSRLQMIGVCHDSLVELVLHSRYAERRAHGEWFDIGTENPLGQMSAGLCVRCGGGLGVSELEMLASLQESRDWARAARESIQMERAVR